MTDRDRTTRAGKRVVYALLVVAAFCALVLATIAAGDRLQPIPQPIRGAAW